MIKIKTKSDLEQLKSTAKVSSDYIVLVESYFLQLLEALCPPEFASDQYDLERDGYVVVLESSDDPHNLAQVGLPHGLSSFPGPEWSEFHELADGNKVWQFAYLMDNDFVMIYYFNDCLWPDDPVMQQFLEDQRAAEQLYSKGCDK